MLSTTAGESLIEFFVEGNPVPKQSFKMGKYGGYQPKRVTDWQEQVAWCASVAYKGEPLETPVSVRLIFRRKDKRRCDLDNLAKAVNDALEGIVFKNDEQIHHLTVYKFYKQDNPGVNITVEKM